MMIKLLKRSKFIHLCQRSVVREPHFWCLRFCSAAYHLLDDISKYFLKCQNLFIYANEKISLSKYRLQNNEIMNLLFAR